MKRSKKKKQGAGGRPYKWASGKTKPVRVPIAFLKEVFALINELDQREAGTQILGILRGIYQSGASHPPEINI